MSTENLVTKKSKYGTLGLDVGFIRRWSRLIWGLLILVPTATNILLNFSPSSDSLRFYGLVLMSFTAITLSYTAVYWFLGERGILQRLNVWVNTAIFVLPAFLLAWWDFIIAPLTGTRLPLALSVAMFIYIGISFILQWRIKYGGCEVVSIPIIFFRKRYPTYCIPLIALDAVEKAVVDRTARTTQEEI
jgi:hypothetical protein